MKVSTYFIEVLKSLPFGFIMILIIDYFKPYSAVANYVLLVIFLLIFLYVSKISKKFERRKAFFLSLLAMYPFIHFLGNIISMN